MLFAQAQSPEGCCLQDGLDLLQFSEVIAAADGPQCFVDLRGFKLRCGEDLANVAFPRMLQIEAKVSPEGELEVALHEVRFEQGHAATDVAADEVGINDPLGDKGGPHRTALARVQVRETNRQAHAFESCRCVELAERFAFDPAIGRGKEAHVRFSQCVHASFLSAVAQSEGGSCPPRRGWGFRSAGCSVQNSAFCTPHSALKWSPRLVSRQRLLLFTEALICLSYSGLNGRPGR